MASSGQGGSNPPSGSARRERLEAQLRANLQRRKQQARTRSDSTPPSSPPLPPRDAQDAGPDPSGDGHD